MRFRLPWQRKAGDKLQVVTTVSKLRTALEGPVVAAVYTMGALHEGHAHLIRAAREYIDTHSERGGQVVVSIFVNPTQFGSESDLKNYPRSYRQDLVLCKVEGVDVVFAPTVEEMYPDSQWSSFQIASGELGNIYEGASRPGHFDGVLTVVNKLTNIMEPDAMFFGEKDFQQLTLVQQMAAAFNMNVEVVGVPTVREQDGLALSSRNKRLDKSARQKAAHLSAALSLAHHALTEGHSAAEAQQAACDYLRVQEGIDLDYFAIVNDKLMHPMPGDSLRALVAATVGGVRLIDNMKLDV
jgi:pantoate--beta-alanine ligase